jgi:hypothetical protein
VAQSVKECKGKETHRRQVGINRLENLEYITRRPVMETREIRVVEKAADTLICIHVLTGRAPAAKMCAHGYECGSCPFDQMLEDMAESRIHIAGLPARSVRAA